MDCPLLAKDELLDQRVEMLLSHLQHIKFLWFNEYPIFKRGHVLAKLLEKYHAAHSHVLFPEHVVDQTQPAPPAVEAGASCCLRRPHKRIVCCHTSAQESSVWLDSKLEQDEQDLLFLGGFIANHLQGNSLKDSMEAGARLARDVKTLAALTGQRLS